MTTITKTEKQAIKESVATATGYLTKLAATTVETYWHLGEIVASLEFSYGDNVVANFSEKLAEEIGPDNAPSDSTLYRARQFYDKYKDLSKILESKISWNQIVQILPESAEDVNPVIDRIAANELPPSKLAETVRGINSVQDTLDEPHHVPELDPDIGEASEPYEKSTQTTSVTPAPPSSDIGDTSHSEIDGSVKSVRKAMRKLISYINALNEVLPNGLIIADSLSNFSEEDLSEVYDELQELQEAFLQLNQAGGPVMKQIRAFEIV